MTGAQAAEAETFALTVNGQMMQTVPTTLADLVARLGHDPASIATAVNGDFVARKARAERRLVAGDQVEIVAPRQGG